MTTENESKQKPLWLLIEENFLGQNANDLSGANREATIQKIAGELDNTGYNVSHHGGHMLQLRWAMDAINKVGRPLLKDINDAIAAFSLEDVTDPYIAANKLITDLGNTWQELKKSERRPYVIEIVEKAKLDLLITKAKSFSENESIRFLIGEEVTSDVITNALGITDEMLGQVYADIEKEKAERARVTTLLEAVKDKPDTEKVKHLFTNEISEELIIEIAKIDQDVIDGVKKAMEEEIKEQQRLAEEAAAKKKAEAEGPGLDQIPSDKMIDFIDSIREIMEFSEVEKEIRVMCEQSAVPKCLVDIAVSDPDRLDELEKAAEG
ncbi:hypothetical protein QUF70_17060 [Desulfobacterales bacterium HSG17]|nr:hypothetical protein [Desulfobacterales bacterium HSG17]